MTTATPSILDRIAAEEIAGWEKAGCKILDNGYILSFSLGRIIQKYTNRGALDRRFTADGEYSYLNSYEDMLRWAGSNERLQTLALQWHPDYAEIKPDIQAIQARFFTEGEPLTQEQQEELTQQINDRLIEHKQLLAYRKEHPEQFYAAHKAYREEPKSPQRYWDQRTTLPDPKLGELKERAATIMAAAREQQIHSDLWRGYQSMLSADAYWDPDRTTEYLEEAGFTSSGFAKYDQETMEQIIGAITYDTLIY